MHTRSSNLSSRILCALFWLLPAVGLHAQGFVHQYPFSTWFNGGAQSVFPQSNGNFRLTATSYPDFGTDIGLSWLNVEANGQLTDVSLVTTSDSIHIPTFFLLENGDYLRADADSNKLLLQHCTAGSKLWQDSLVFPGFQSVSILALRPNDSGEIFVHASLWYADSTMAIDSGLLAKYTSQGHLLWLRKHSLDVTFVSPQSLVPTPDGGCLFANYAYDAPGTSGEAVLRFAANGALSWSYTPQNGYLFPYTLDYALAVNPAGEALVPVRHIDNTLGTDTLWLDKLAPNGQVAAETNLSAALGLLHLLPDLTFPVADGWVMTVGYYQMNSWQKYVVRLDNAGNIRWQKQLSFLEQGEEVKFTDGMELADGTLALYGQQQTRLILIKIAADGTIYPHTVTGEVRRDSTFNCINDPNDPPLPGWIVTAEGNGLVHFATTDATGHYAIPDLDTGQYLIHIVPQNYLWSICGDSMPVTFSGSVPQTDTVDLPVQPLYDCPVMQVDLGTVGFRRCFGNQYLVQYCNTGNQAAETAICTLTLDPLLQVDSASIPFTQDNGQLHFGLGTVAPGECGSFQVYMTLSCAAELGQTLCSEAHISPDTLCVQSLPDWSGAAIEVSAACVGDSVEFAIRNVGLAPSSMLDFIVIDDHVITRQGTVSLPPSGVFISTAPANGSTWRLTTQQEPGFPFGPQMPSVALEGCIPAGGGFSTGMLNLFANYSGNPFEDIDCRTVVGSFDPNDKQAFPVGVDAQHFIEANQALDYQIDFQNTGTDTAFTVVIRDTLSARLDLTTIRPGAGSHPYTWALSGTGVLTFIFNNILLPDSNVNEPASHGFVRFRIDQRPDNPPGTLLENRAGIYFDFNAPVITNTVWHTIGHDFLTVASPEAATAVPQLHVWPNPARQTTTVWLEKPFESGRTLVLRDALGRPVKVTNVPGEKTELSRAGLPAGLYFIELRDAHRLLAAGKVIWE